MRLNPLPETVLITFFALVFVACGGGPTEAVERIKAGVELQEKGRSEEAIAEDDEAIRLDPQDAANTYNNRGTAYAVLGQFQRATEDFGDAISELRLRLRG